MIGHIEESYVSGQLEWAQKPFRVGIRASLIGFGVVVVVVADR